MDVNPFGDPLFLITFMATVGLAPFIIMMMTSFVKVAAVLSIVRNALGIQQVPPNAALNGLALVITFFIMAPVIFDTLKLSNTLPPLPRPFKITYVADAATHLIPPWKEFLKRNTKRSIADFFVNTAKRVWPKEQSEKLTTESMFILIPAFTVSEMTKAFEIGFLLFLPFFVIDLIISNVLLALGMMMVSPATIALPFKLLLFVLIDGWTKIIYGLILGYY
ncbi:MAG: type III secretion system export apparatus subunit SctR [Desulfovibrionaceae bacterium]